MARRQTDLIASAALAVVLAGCSFESAEFDPGLRCGDDDLCPGGQSCVAGVCGAPVEHDATVSADDASIPDDAAPPACDLTSPWGTPAPLPGVNSDRIDMVGRLSPDELAIYFQSDRDTAVGATVDLYVATRASIADGFGIPTILANVNTADNDSDVSVAADALTLFAGRSTAGFTNGDIYVASRTTALSAFGPPALATISLPTADDNQPFHAGNSLWFTSNRPESLGGRDIFQSTLSGGVLGAPVAASVINSAAEDWLPMLTADQLTLYFGSTRPHADASGLFDIWTSTRPDLASPFSPPTLVRELNSAFQDFPSWISPDGCRLYLSSDRIGSTDIYVSEREPWPSIDPRTVSHATRSASARRRVRWRLRSGGRLGHPDDELPRVPRAIPARRLRDVDQQGVRRAL